MIYSCGLSGHRLIESNDFSPSVLEKNIIELAERGCRVFYCGMAMGFDMLAAEIVQSFKNLSVIACLPCREQADKYPYSERLRYNKILKNCIDVVTLSDEYYNGCMFARDRYIVEKSDVLLCYLRKKKGGTFYTYNYAKSLDREIIII
jgi:uncharacterized phage-like protein YoqJ